MAAKDGLSRCIEILERLVAFQTVSDRSNRDLIDWVEVFLSRLGLATTIVSSTDGNKANLFATLGPSDRGGVLLSGHSDVVPVEGQRWSSDPFVLTRKQSRLYARGTADMKGFIACALAALEAAADLPLKTPIHLALSYDEEVGCLGVPFLIERFGADLPLPLVALVGEPTGLRLVNAHKGFRAYRTTFHGEPAHSSQPDSGMSAVRMAATFLQALEALATELRSSPPAKAAGIEPPHTTVSVGRISGGAAINIVPQDCVVEWEFRPSPGEAVESVVKRLGELYGSLLPDDLRRRGALERTNHETLAIEPIFVPESDGLAEQLLAGLTGHNRSEGAPYGTEAGFFQSAGISTVLIGPGEIAQAHQPDEYVEVDQLAAAMKLLQALTRWAMSNELTGS